MGENECWARLASIGANTSSSAHLLRDRDKSYGPAFRYRVRAMGITEVITAPRSPWQNPYVERLIGSIRRECLDHVIILNERHLRRVLLSYFQYHHDARTHLSLSKDCPRPRRVQLPSAGNLIASPRSAVCIIAMSVEPREIGEAARSARPNPFALNSFLSKDTLYRSRPVKLSAISAACGPYIMACGTSVANPYPQRRTRTIPSTASIF
jgi:transposase InsO family protein